MTGSGVQADIPLERGAPVGEASSAPASRCKLVSAGDIAYVLYPLLPTRWLFAAARLGGRLAYLMGGRARRAVSANLRAAFGETKSPEEIATLTGRIFEQQQLQNLLVTLAPRMSTPTLERLVPIEGLEYLDAALAHGRGAMLVASHLNSASQFAALILLRRKGYDVGLAMPNADDPWEETRLRRALDRWVRRPSLREQIDAFPAQFNVRPIAARLARNAIAVTTGDGLHSAAFAQVEFLGRRLPFTTGPFSVARSTGAPIVMMFSPGIPTESMRVILEPPVTVSRTDPPRQAVTEHVTTFASRLDRHVRASPASWQHWLTDNLLGTMTTWRQTSLSDRYRT